MSTDSRYMTFGLMLGVLGLEIGVSLATASFMVGVGTAIRSDYILICEEPSIWRDFYASHSLRL